MARRKTDPEETAELTGSDAPAEEADFGSAGNGADPFEADLAGTSPDSRSLEPEPRARDIRPDGLERHVEKSKEGEEQPEPTAQPTEWPALDASRLP